MMESEGEPETRRRHQHHHQQHEPITRVASSDGEFDGGGTDTQEGEGDAADDTRRRRFNCSDTEDERLPEERRMERRMRDIPQGSDRTLPFLDSLLSPLSDKWRNWVVRFIFGSIMIFTFAGVIYLGPMAIMVLILILQVKCYQEIISIGYAVYRVHNLPWFRSLSWYFLITSNYFFYGESLVDYISIFGNKTAFLKNLTSFHRFISFCLYIMGFVWFVLSLVKKYYMRQFSLFAWTHVTLLAIVTQSYLMLQNLFNGVIWFLIPVSMVIINDIFAYFFGFFFGRTPLIQLSPRKTWEGFIGGGITTVLLGALISHYLCQFQHFICPIGYDSITDSIATECSPSPMFTLTTYSLAQGWLGGILTFIGLEKIVTYPFVLHSVALSLFSSSIGPFGGFFASGFKRAFKIKDFGDVIPGHGGIVDRFDCQILMATFVNVYYHSFIKSPDANKLIGQISLLDTASKFQIFKELSVTLLSAGVINNSTQIEQVFSLISPNSS